MSHRVYFDGLNLALEQGTGIATYTRLLTEIAHELGYDIGVVYSSPHEPPSDPLLRDISFFDPNNAFRISQRRRSFNRFVDQVRCLSGFPVRPIKLTGAVIYDQFKGRLPLRNEVFIARDVFANSRVYYGWSGRFVELIFDRRPDIFHCTYQLPMKVKGARNIYTIHDLVPLRLPYTTLDEKRQTYRLLQKIAVEADHIVTVSEHSRRDIIDLLGVDPERITNTYEAVDFPQEYIKRADDIVAEQLDFNFQLGMRDYLLFYGALEPKKNIGRLIEAYLLSAVGIPLVITGPPGWGTTREVALLTQLCEGDKLRAPSRRRFYRIDYVNRSMLVTLIRGARAVLFPSLYEGFGLPVLEAMMLGTPVLTSRVASLPEIAGDAAMYVDPYNVDDIARGIKTIAADGDMRQDLAVRGRAQAEQFSIAHYRQRIEALYRRLS